METNKKFSQQKQKSDDDLHGCTQEGKLSLFTIMEVPVTVLFTVQVTRSSGHFIDLLPHTALKM